MAFQRVPLTIAISFVARYTAFTREYINTLYFANLGSWSDAMVDTALAAAITAWNDNLDQYTPTGGQLVRAEALNLDVEFGYNPVTAVGNVGAEAGAMSSANNAAYIKFTCAGNGAPREGGVFWPFVQEADVGATGVLSGDALLVADEYEDVAQAIEASVASTTHVVPSRYSKTANPTPPHKRTVAAINNVVGYSVRPIVASQRDRRG